MAHEYAVRIHEFSDDVCSRLCDFVKSIPGSYVFARETEATRAHFQGWIRSDIKQQAFRVRLKKAFPECVGNKQYSITMVKCHDSYARYILKGTRDHIADIVCFSGIQITRQYLQAEHDAYWSSHPEKQKSILDEVEAWAMMQKWSDVYEKRRDLAKRVCDAASFRNKGMNVFFLRSLFNTLMYRLDGRFADDIVSEIISKY